MSAYSTPNRFARTDTPTLSKAISNASHSCGSHDTNSVRGRIRQWQAQGGGVVEADDLLVANPSVTYSPPFVDSEVESQKSPLRSRARRNGEVRHSKGSGKPPSRVPGNSDRGIRTPIRDGSTPAKRVVSDAHWRKKRSPPSCAKSSNAGNGSPALARRDGNARERSTPTTQPSKRKSRESGRASFEVAKIEHDEVIFDEVPSPELRWNFRRRRSGQSACSVSDRSDSNPLPLGTSPTQLDSAQQPAISLGRRRECSSQDIRKDCNRLASKNSIDEVHGSLRMQPAGNGSVKSSKCNALSQVFKEKKMFAKQGLEPTPSPRIPSIEAWLNDTHDPFLEDDVNVPAVLGDDHLNDAADTSDQGAKEKISLKSSHCEKMAISKLELPPKDPNQIWNLLDTKEGTRRAVNRSIKKRRIPSSAIYQDNPFPPNFDSGSNEGAKTASKIVDLVRDVPDTSSHSLKRRGARKSMSSPVSSSHERQAKVAEEDDTKSARSSNCTESSVEGPDSAHPNRPPGIDLLRRPFPSTGTHRLSTIVSVETFDSKLQASAPSVIEVSERAAQPFPTNIPRKDFRTNSVNRRNSHLTKHADLISVLSLPRAGNKSIQSARSIRTDRTRLDTATSEDIMRELSMDEAKYMRELHTLVDGVIPVLLTCVLSKADSAVAAGLFQPTVTNGEDANFTRPIIDMGIALERLKTMHRRIPLDNPTAILTWAHGAQRVYTEYLRAWRMGFQDVIVNLAPAVDDKFSSSPSQDLQSPALAAGMLRNEDGDVINGDGERVDVAFLLKRPLVRLKYLAKTLKGINIVKPSAEAASLAVNYQRLVEDAKRRLNEERARLEDEAASNIDATRARDPKTLAPLVGVVVDHTRCVRARDNFSLALQHSSGQRVDCRVELLFRDKASELGKGGDLLICEIDETGRWLLFPPVRATHVSARNGDVKGEIVVMIRGLGSHDDDWQELLSLTTEDEQVGFEWVQMLGLIPVPPKITKFQKFLGEYQKSTLASSMNPSRLDGSPSPTIQGSRRTPNPREVEVPIGEQVKIVSHDLTKHSPAELSPTLLGALPREPTKKRDLLATPPKSSHKYVDHVNDLRSLPSQSRNRELPRVGMLKGPRSFKEALGLSGTSTTVGLKRTRAKRASRADGGSPTTRGSSSSHLERSLGIPSPHSGDVEQSELHDTPGSSDICSRSPNDSFLTIGRDTNGPRTSPISSQSTSSVPSKELPYIPKARKDNRLAKPVIEEEEEEEWTTPAESSNAHKSAKAVKRHRSSAASHKSVEAQPPPAPSHGDQSTMQLKNTKTPLLESSHMRSRRSSSPLKHEYEPSSASDSSSHSDTSTVERRDNTSVSDSSEDEEFDDEVSPAAQVPMNTLKEISKPIPKTASFSTAIDSIKPSESASQAPARTNNQAAKVAKTIASIFSWSDTGSWQSLHPDECSIVITAGLIEAFEMSAAHSGNMPLSVSEAAVDSDQLSELASNLTSQNDNVRGDRPLIGLELTPLVPLRRGTALDISVRSPPTANSQITSGNNIMFRSRNPGECEALYALINHSRINNPTFIALQNARGPYGPSNAFSASIDRRTSTGGGSSRSSWFGGWGRSSSYRASSAPTPSIVLSESSIGSMSSAFSALKRFSRASGGVFNIPRSTISSRGGSRANSVCTSSDNSSGSGTSSPIPPGLIDARKEAPIGLSNAKIRIYIRETVSKWRDMGSARLTIMRAERNNLGPDGRPMSSGIHGIVHEKRILVHGKTKGEVLLDVQLGESCFERVGRTGIAVSVWEDVVGPNGEVGMVGAVGGVAGGRAKIYMIQVFEPAFATTVQQSC